jgi:hypothetical protein
MFLSGAIIGQLLQGAEVSFGERRLEIGECTLVTAKTRGRALCGTRDDTVGVCFAAVSRCG